jgi:RimJ/RimL family protein N-acetyltransferase
VIVQPLTPESAFYVATLMRESDRREIDATLPTDFSDSDFARCCAACAPFAWTVGLDREPIACVGVQRLWPGVWQAWLFSTPRFDEIGFRLTLFAQRRMMPAVARAGARRVHAYSIEGHGEAHRWLERLGAQHEATLRGYGSRGEDFRLYRWLRED